MLKQYYNVVGFDETYSKINAYKFLSKEWNLSLKSVKHIFDDFAFDPIEEKDVYEWESHGFQVESIFNWRIEAQDMHYKNTLAPRLRDGLELKDPKDREKFETFMDLYYDASDELKEVIEQFFEPHLPMA